MFLNTRRICKVTFILKLSSKETGKRYRASSVCLHNLLAAYRPFIHNRIRIWCRMWLFYND